MVSDLRRIYRHFGIRIDYWAHPLRNLRGAFFNDELGASVMVAKNLPDDPKIFTLSHELKHYLCDRDSELSFCDSSNQNSHIEIGAEVFAAELIFPEADFRDWVTDLGVAQGALKPEDLVRLKVQTRTTLSYAGLAKRAEFFHYCPAGSLAKIRWKKLEEQMYGEPLYKQIQRRRAQRENRTRGRFLDSAS